MCWQISTQSCTHGVPTQQRSKDRVLEKRNSSLTFFLFFPLSPQHTILLVLRLAFSISLISCVQNNDAFFVSIEKNSIFIFFFFLKKIVFWCIWLFRVLWLWSYYRWARKRKEEHEIHLVQRAGKEVGFWCFTVGTDENRPDTQRCVHTVTEIAVLSFSAATFTDFA